MRSFRHVLLGAALLAGLVGCQQGGPDGPKDKAPRKLSSTKDPVRSTPNAATNPDKKAAPSQPLKAAKGLKAPDGVEVTDSKMPKSYWSSYENARVGDLSEYEMPETKAKSKSEVYDIADHVVMIVTEITMSVEGKDMTTKSAMRMVFDAPEPDEVKDEEKLKFTKRAEKKAFTVNGKTVYSDTLSESSKGGKVQARSWSSKELPAAVLEVQDGEGKATMRLVRYQRGK